MSPSITISLSSIATTTPHVPPALPPSLPLRACATDRQAPRARLPWPLIGLIYSFAGPTTLASASLCSFDSLAEASKHLYRDVTVTSEEQSLKLFCARVSGRKASRPHSAIIPCFISLFVRLLRLAAESLSPIQDPNLDSPRIRPFLNLSLIGTLHVDASSDDDGRHSESNDDLDGSLSEGSPSSSSSSNDSTPYYFIEFTFAERPSHKIKRDRIPRWSNRHGSRPTVPIEQFLLTPSRKPVAWPLGLISAIDPLVAEFLPIPSPSGRPGAFGPHLIAEVDDSFKWTRTTLIRLGGYIPMVQHPDGQPCLFRQLPPCLEAIEIDLSTPELGETEWESVMVNFWPSGLLWEDYAESRPDEYDGALAFKVPRQPPMRARVRFLVPGEVERDIVLDGIEEWYDVQQDAAAAFDWEADFFSAVDRFVPTTAFFGDKYIEHLEVVPVVRGDDG